MAGPGRPPGSRAPILAVWTITFLYAAIAGVLVQLVVLPYFLPAWHHGNGLLVGGDWIAFHNYAVAAAERIRAEGWSTFTLRPRGYAPVGIASAIYALTWPKPWMLIPLNAALHATAATLLFRLLRGFVADWRWALLGTAPFVFYPSALMWVSQLHKDGFAVAGYLCLFVAWAELARLTAGPGGWRPFAAALFLVPVGLGLTWLVRPDLTVVSHAGAGLALAVLVCRIGRGAGGWRRGAAVFALVLLTTLGSVWLTRGQEGSFAKVGRVQIPGPASAEPTRVSAFEPEAGWGGLRRGVAEIPWYRSAWLPAAVDRQVFYRMGLIRETYHLEYLESRSNADADVGFYRAADVLRYAPRAFQIALLAPFPTDWREAGSSAWTTAGRRVVAVEMLGVYAALLALVAAAWRWRRRADFWIVVLPCLVILEIYSLAVPNLGALHRFRYVFLMTLVGLGLAGGLEPLSRRLAQMAPLRRYPARPPARSA